MPLPLRPIMNANVERLATVIVARTGLRRRATVLSRWLDVGPEIVADGPQDEGAVARDVLHQSVATLRRRDPRNHTVGQATRRLREQVPSQSWSRAA